MLREVTEKKEETLSFKEGQFVTIGTVLERLGTQYGKTFADYVFDKQSREVRGYLQFFINGHSVVAKELLETKLHDGDVVAIVPPVGGG